MLHSSTGPSNSALHLRPPVSEVRYPRLLGKSVSYRVRQNNRKMFQPVRVQLMFLFKMLEQQKPPALLSLVRSFERPPAWCWAALEP